MTIVSLQMFYRKFFDSISIRYFDVESFSIRYRFDILMLEIFRFDIDSIFWCWKFFDSISIRYFDFKKFRFDIDSIFWNRNFVDSISIRYFDTDYFSIRYRFDISISKFCRFDIDSIFQSHSGSIRYRFDISNRNRYIEFDIEKYRRFLFNLF